jgi:hypothetical protein
VAIFSLKVIQLNMSSTEIKSTKSPFLFLACELPPPPLFQDAIEGKNIIPQVSIYQVLSKYDGMNAQEYAGQVKRFKCQRLPPYIILHFKRFTKNFFVEEKNPTIVNFPLKGLDFKDCECIQLPLYFQPPAYAIISQSSTSQQMRRPYQRHMTCSPT